MRGFIAARTEDKIVDDKGRKVIDTAAYDFLRDGRAAPDTVNPHLWRHATLNAHHGLFEVAKGVWQVRGYDISNITFIQGDKGWAVNQRCKHHIISTERRDRPRFASVICPIDIEHYPVAVGNAELSGDARK